MGNNLGTQEPTESLINHPKFKDSDILLQKNIIRTIVTVYDEKELEDWIESIEQIKGFDQQFLFNPKSYTVIRRALCGNSCVLKIAYENYPYILIDQIKSREKLKRTFQQNQICASNDFLKKDSSLGDVRPHNIFFNETGSIKVAHRFSWPGQQSNFQKSKFQNSITFLAPEEIQLLFNGKIYNTNNIRKSQSFSIGLSVLCAIYLEDFSSLYNLKDNTFNQQVFNQKIKNLNKLKYYSQQDHAQFQYSPQLLNLIQWLCQTNPDKRISSLEIHKYLLPYEDQILMFKSFNFKMPSNVLKPSLLRIQTQSDEIQNQRQAFSYIPPSNAMIQQKNQSRKNSTKNVEREIEEKKETPRKRISVSIHYGSKNQSPSFSKKEVIHQNENKNRQRAITKSPVFTADRMIQIKGKETTSRKISPIMKVSDNNNDKQILQKIEMQLLKSRNMFPS